MLRVAGGGHAELFVTDKCLWLYPRTDVARPPVGAAAIDARSQAMKR